MYPVTLKLDVTDDIAGNIQHLLWKVCKYSRAANDITFEWTENKTAVVETSSVIMSLFSRQFFQFYAANSVDEVGVNQNEDMVAIELLSAAFLTQKLASSRLHLNVENIASFNEMGVTECVFDMSAKTIKDNLVRVLKNQSSRRGFDIVFSWGGDYDGGTNLNSYKAHSFVLGAFSKQIERAISAHFNDGKTESKGVYALAVDGENVAKGFRDILSFIYNGEITFTNQQQLQCFIQTVDHYEFDCIKEMLSANNLWISQFWGVDLLVSEYSSGTGSELFREALKTVKNQFCVLPMAEMQKIDTNLMTEIICADDLPVICEWFLVQKLLQWFEGTSYRDDGGKFVQLFQHIRLHMLHNTDDVLDFIEHAKQMGSDHVNAAFVQRLVDWMFFTLKVGQVKQPQRLGKRKADESLSHNDKINEFIAISNFTGAREQCDIIELTSKDCKFKVGLFGQSIFHMDCQYKVIAPCDDFEIGLVSSSDIYKEFSNMSDANIDNGFVKFDALQTKNVVLHKLKSAGMQVVMTVEITRAVVRWSFYDESGLDCGYEKPLGNLEGPWIPFFQFERKDGIDVKAMEWGPTYNCFKF